MEAGLYIHIPFCLQKCSYCDFNSFPAKAGCKGIQEYVDCLVKEMQMQSGEMRGHEFTSVFMGGGTPTILLANQIRAVMEAAYVNFSISKSAEITVESNPKTLDMEKLEAMRESGVNRLSIGLQAVQEGILKTLGRIHSYEDFERNYNDARKAGFDNINVDIMFSIPGQSMQDWMLTLEKVADLSPEHISAYSLIVEDKTLIAERIQGGELECKGEDEDRRMYHYCVEYLKERGYRQYEISNFARPGRESRHNIKYWKCEEYLGLGPGAHSYIGEVRYSNVSALKEYCEMIMAKNPAIERSEQISSKQRMEEMMFMGLRMNDGVLTADFDGRFEQGIEAVYGEKIKKLEGMGLLKVENHGSGQRISLTRRGVDISNTVFVEFLID